MARAIWKGSISFGLVNIPVELYSGENRAELSLNMLDSRNQSRVRYVRVNEETGQEVPSDAIAKGYEYESGRYVLLSDDELAQVRAEVTKTVEIEDFVDLQAIEPRYFDKPYFLVPQTKPRAALKGYALLRETLRQTGKVGIARVVIRSKEYLCAVMVQGQMILLNILRYAEELRDPKEHSLPGDNLEELNISPKEIQLATQLVEAMTGAWEPHRYHDRHRAALMEWIEQKIAGIPHEKVEPQPQETAGKVVDLMEYLKQSVEEATGQRNSASADSATGTQGKRKVSKSPAAKKKASHHRKAG